MASEEIILPTDLQACCDLDSGDYDAIVVVAPSVNCLNAKKLKEPLLQIVSVDQGAESDVFIAPAKDLICKRIVFSSTGALDKDYDDVRRYADAAEKGIKKAIKAGSKAPLLFIHMSHYPQAAMVAALGALKALYVPLETCEHGKSTKVSKLGIFTDPLPVDKVLQLKLVQALEAGRIVSRDIGGSDPERMAAPRVEEYIRKTFKGTGVKIEVIQGQAVFEKEYPCLAAVNRSASGQPRHDGRVIWLTYEPQGPVEKTLMLVGKGITYDTGGADIKAGGHMAGMSRDKCGAADVAGIFRVASILKPKNVKLIGAMAMVRNSVGSNCFVSDEIITARSGVRLRVGNTDAEGRMVMVDVLCQMKEKALTEINAHLMTIATLTGHAHLCVGNYTAVMDNGPARKESFAYKLQQTGEEYGDPVEVSTVRREDFDFIVDKCGEFVEVLQCNNLPSVQTSRGHQFPAAFLQKVSGLDKHMLTSEQPLKYTHLDVAGSSGDLPHPTTAASVVALSMHFFHK